MRVTGAFPCSSSKVARERAQSQEALVTLWRVSEDLISEVREGQAFCVTGLVPGKPPARASEGGPGSLGDRGEKLLQLAGTRTTQWRHVPRHEVRMRAWDGPRALRAC